MKLRVAINNFIYLMKNTMKREIERANHKMIFRVNISEQNYFVGSLDGLKLKFYFRYEFISERRRVFDCGDHSVCTR